MQFLSASHHSTLFARSESFEILSKFNLDTCQLCKLQDQISNFQFPTGANVVNLAGTPMLEKVQVSFDDIAHIQEISRDINVAYLQQRRLLSTGDLNQLLGHAGNDEAVGLACADMIKRASHQDSPGLGITPLQAELFCRELAHRIGIAWLGQPIFANGQVGLVHLPVDVTRAYIKESASKPARLECLQQVEGA